MEREDLTELHYLTPISNVPSILEHGILSHRRARRVPHDSVAMEQLQERRARVTVPGGRPLHEYVNLYVHARNPMLYKRRTQTSSLCVLRIDAGVLDLLGVVVADQNAGSDYVRFAPSPDGLRMIDKELVFAESWSHSDRIEYFRRKSARCAEILVPDAVPTDRIQGAYVASDASRLELERLAPAIHATIDPHLFFL